MAEVTERIEHMTGRTVEFVPPMPYLTSGPVPLAPATLEVIGKTERLPEPRPTPRANGKRGDTVEVDATDVIDKGTSPRMLLTVDDGAGLSLHPELKVSRCRDRATPPLLGQTF